MCRTLFGASVVLLLATVRISAHHAFAAEYDAGKTVTVSGTVVRLKWINPHVWLYVDGKDEDGKAAEWAFEMGSPNGLLRRGWRKGELKVGDPVTVDGFCAKDGSNVANARNVALPDGRTLFGGFQTTPGAPAK